MATELAATSGEGSQRARERLLAALLGRLTADEQHHLVRVLGGEMRQGANDGVLTDAVAKAAGVPSTAVRRAAMMLGDLGAAAARALAGESLDVGLTTGVGVQPMLAGTAAERRPTRWRSPGRRASSGSSTAPVCRCTGAATRCGCSPAASATSPRAVPELVACVRARCRSTTWCSTARRSASTPTARPWRSRTR